MSAMQVRDQFHLLIDRINDTERLRHLYEVLADTDTVPAEITDELSSAQKVRLETALHQIKTGDVISHEAVKKEISEWLSH
jgi:hypothetical protein